ncbi:MAG: oligosaccharide flippase family protein [Anaerolineae bacterium]|nr:oligosaccharide flippase family protein [Anaerolineae bacterium]
MIKKVFRDSAVYTVATVLSRGISLILLPLYTRFLSPNDYGSLDLLTVLAALVHLTIALEISQGVSRFFPEAENHSERVSYASTALWFTLAIYSAFAVLGLIFSRELSTLILDTPSQQGIVQIALVNLWLTGLLYRTQGQLRFQLRPVAYSAVSILQILATAGGTLLFLIHFKMGIYAVFIGQIIGTFSALALSFFLSRQVHRFTFSRKLLGVMLAFSIPLMPSSAAVFISTYLDRILIKEMMTVADVGIFGIAIRISSIISLAFVGFQVALTPLIYTHYKEPETPAALARISRYVVGVSLLLFSVLAVFAREIIGLLAPETYQAAAAVLPTLVLATLVSLLYILAPGLGIAKQTKRFAVINIAGAVINTILNLILIPRIGIQGAAVATLISASVTLAITMFYSQRLYYVPHRWLPYAAVLLVVLVIFAVSGQFYGTTSDIFIKAGLIATVIAAIIGFGLVKPSEITSFLRPFFQRFQRPSIIS